MLIERIIEHREPGNILTCETGIPVREAVALLAGKRIGALPVVENGAVVGIFSERDVIYRLASEGEMCLSLPVGEVMTAPAITIGSREKTDDALALIDRIQKVQSEAVPGADRGIGAKQLQQRVRNIEVRGRARLEPRLDPRPAEQERDLDLLG